MTRLDTRSQIAAGALAIGMLMAVRVLAQEPDTKPHQASPAEPVAQAPRPDQIRVKEDVQKAKLVHMVSPLYPPFLGRRLDGTVVLHVIIGTNGAVKSAKYVSGPETDMTSAVNAVLQWRYKPTLRNGLPVEVDTTVSAVFDPLGKEGAVAYK